MEKIKLQLLEKDLKESGISRSQIISNISHEIKTPLNSIISASELLKARTDNNELKDLAETIYRSGHHLFVLLNNVLDFYKTSFSGISLDNHPFDLYVLLDELYHLFMVKAEEKSISLSFHIDSAIQRIWNGDAVRIRQMLYNLLDNAFKFTLKGTVSLSVSLKEKDEKHAEIIFNISDTGTGIQSDLESYIWQFFSSVDISNSRNQQGLGMGLALTRSIAMLMNGNIILNKTDNKGTEIQLSVTLNKENCKDISNAELFKNILLVEDNLVNQKLTKNLLEKQGYNVDVANNGFEAIEQFKLNHYNLILMDIQMPQCDGIRASEEIRAIEKQNKILAPIKIIALTANSHKQDKNECLSAGMNDYMRKPLDISNFSKILCRLTN
ncbi:MAG: response regulator [Bacteroidales bacterium]|nr:response regulator [Bacteroidales bacterium]